MTAGEQTVTGHTVLGLTQDTAILGTLLVYTSTGVGRGPFSYQALETRSSAVASRSKQILPSLRASQSPDAPPTCAWEADSPGGGLGATTRQLCDLGHGSEPL